VNDEVLRQTLSH